jgi:hypothetical protein
MSCLDFVAKEVEDLFMIRRRIDYQKLNGCSLRDWIDDVRENGKLNGLCSKHSLENEEQLSSLLEDLKTIKGTFKFSAHPASALNEEDVNYDYCLTLLKRTGVLKGGESRVLTQMELMNGNRNGTQFLQSV